MTNLVEGAEDLEEIVESIIELGKLKEKQNELQMKCEFVLGDAYEDDFRNKFNTSKNKISECINPTQSGWGAIRPPIRFCYIYLFHIAELYCRFMTFSLYLFDTFWANLDC